MSKKINTTKLHKLPLDLKKVLDNDSKANFLWQDITPLAKNEFICWVTSAMKDETREKRIRRTIEELKEGKRRPCCWAGCSHR